MEVGGKKEGGVGVHCFAGGVFDGGHVAFVPVGLFLEFQVLRDCEGRG